MPYNIGIKGKNLEKFFGDVKDPRFIGEVVGAGLGETAKLAARELRNKVPIRSGRLRRTIRAARVSSQIYGQKVSRSAGALRIGNRSARGEGGVYYFHFLEYGTRRGIRPRLYLHRTLGEQQNAFYTVFQREALESWERNTRDLLNKTPEQIAGTRLGRAIGR